MKNIAGITLNPMWATMGTIAIVIAFLLTAWPALAQSAQPATPQNLQVIDKTHRSVTIGWDDPGDSSIAGYKILRRQIPIMAAGNFKVIEENTNSTSTQYTDTEDYLEPNIQYVYRVQAVNADDALSRKSNSVRVRVLRWQAPQNLWAQSTARDDGKYDVILTWDSEHADTHLVTGYLVSRRVLAPMPESDFTELDRGRFSGQERGRHVDSGVWPRVYEYQIKAKTVNGSLGLPASVTMVEVGTISEPAGEDLPDDPSTIGYVQVDGETATGEIANRKNPYDHDYFRVDLTARYAYRIDVKGDEELDYGGTLQNPYVLLWRVNEEGAVENLLAGNPYVTVAGGYSFVGIDNHNSGKGENARLKIAVHKGGSYLLDIRGIGSNIRPIDYGTYSVTVARTAELGTFSEPRGEDLPDDPSTIGYVQVDGETATGKIANRKNPYDHDYFRVDLTGGHSYRIDVKGDEELDYGGTLQNPYVLLWRVNEEGAVENLLAGNPYVTVAGGYSFVGIDDHNSGEGKNARLKIDVLIGGSYLLDIRGIGSNIRPIDYGTYSVTLARTDDD